MQTARRGTIMLVVVIAILLDAQTVGTDDVPRYTSFDVSTETAWGIHTVFFKTPYGRIVVNLPSDATTGDTLWCTVFVEPQKGTETTLQENTVTLRAFGIDIGGDEAPAGSSLRIVELASVKGQLPVRLLDRGGKELRAARIPLYATPPPFMPKNNPGYFVQISGYSLPRMGHTGKPLKIFGAFDLRYGVPGAVYVGGKTAPLIAASPRQLVVRGPDNVVGETELILQGDELTVWNAYRSIVIDVTLTATEIFSGDTAYMAVAVRGLEGLEDTLFVPIENSLPAFMRMEGGNVQVMIIRPNETGGCVKSYHAEYSLRGKRAAKFAVTIRPPAGGGNGGTLIGKVLIVPARRTSFFMR